MRKKKRKAALVLALIFLAALAAGLYACHDRSGAEACADTAGFWFPGITIM